MKKNLVGWGKKGDDDLPSYMGIINKPCNKDPYEPSSISWKVVRSIEFSHQAQVTFPKISHKFVQVPG